MKDIDKIKEVLQLLNYRLDYHTEVIGLLLQAVQFTPEQIQAIKDLNSDITASRESAEMLNRILKK